MKTIKLLLYSFVFLMICGCKESREPNSTSAAEVENWLKAFQSRIHVRKTTEHYSDALFTADGVFIVSTQPGTVNKEGRVTLAGESRTQGYFIAPRMMWVDSILEAKRLIVEDIKASKGLPLAAYTKNAEQVVGGNGG